MKLQLSKLITTHPTDMWSKVKGIDIEVVGDSVCSLKATELILSSYAWYVAAQYGVTPLCKHNIVEHYKHGVLCPSSFNNLFNAVLWHCVDTLGIEDDPPAIFKIVKSVMLSNNMLYNDLVMNTSEHIVAIDLVDFIHLTEDEVLLSYRRDSNDEGDTPDSVSNALSRAEAHLMVDDELDATSSIAWHCRRSLVKTGQALQACFMRGYLHDIDRARIDKPILSNLTEGMSLTDYALLSRESSISMAAGNGDIQQVSVDGRRMSYVGGSKSYIIKGDCGTTEYIKWKVSEKDKTSLLGMWFYSEDNTTLRVYTKPDIEKYMNQYIHRRSPLTCHLTNAKHTCSKCFGVLSQSIPFGRNVGVTIPKHIASIFVQRTLSTKHYVSSIGSGKNTLDVRTQMYFKMKDDAIYLKKKPGVKRLEIIVDMNSMYDIQSIFNVTDVRTITMGRITNISKGCIVTSKTLKVSREIFDVSDGKNNSMLSYQLADYLQKNKHLLTTRGNEYVIDVTHYDKKYPVFVRTAKMVNLRDSSSKILAALEKSDSIKTNEVFSKSYGIMDTLVWLIESLAAGYGISAPAVELLFSAYLTKGETCLLHRGLAETKHKKLHTIIRNRSLSFWFLFDRSTESFTQPGPMLVKKRVNSPLDVIVCPASVIDKLEKRNDTCPYTKLRGKTVRKIPIS